MKLFRVVVSFFMPTGIQFMAERGILAMTPGQALDETLVHLEIDQTKITSFKCWTEVPDRLDNFSEDAQYMKCLNTSYSVRDFWTKRYEA